MKHRFLLGFLVLLAFDTAGQVGFKLTADAVGVAVPTVAWAWAVLRTPTTFVICGAYLGSFITYMSLLSRSDVGPLFAASHLELVTVTAVSAIWFGERFGASEAMGCLLIMGGVLVLGLTEERELSGHAA
jgi:drug/metabolite transporter (DMT)-like permease